MTTKKDLTGSENTDLNKRLQEDPEKQRSNAETEIKNAHAAGDGAMGPNETPLPGVGNKQGEEPHETPPY
jgi:hypothetical protein